MENNKKIEGKNIVNKSTTDRSGNKAQKSINVEKGIKPTRPPILRKNKY